MGFSKVVYLYCDGNTDSCEHINEEASSGDSPAKTIAEYKSCITGWHFKGYKAYCPSCWQALKGQK